MSPILPCQKLPHILTPTVSQLPGSYPASYMPPSTPLAQQGSTSQSSDLGSLVFPAGLLDGKVEA